MSSILGVYSDHVRVHRVDNFMPTVLQKTSTDGPTSGSWSMLLSVGATGVLRVQYLRVLRVLAVFQYFGIIYVVFAVFRGSVLRLMPVLQVYMNMVFRGSMLRELYPGLCAAHSPQYYC